jgi:UDP-N-acetylglucosamine--N-acetylmuramyl-(pentapeptide) pyrophosphoryl-undecaprenol N-acetylglucosamine transferase
MTEQTDGLRLAIAGGGTGGHVSPALAVVEELRQRGCLRDAVWIGSHDGLERAAAHDAHIRFVAIPTGKLRRYLSLRNVTDAARVPLGVVAAWRALRSFRPDVVFSTGGFVSVPTVVAARGIAPVLTHEQTAILGLATRINARFASVLAVSHPQTEAEACRIHHHVVLTGNPVRRALGNGDRDRCLTQRGFIPGLPLVYVTGGARGASPINQRVARMLPDLLQSAQVLHQTGPASANGDGNHLAALRESLPEPQRRRYRVVDFIHDDLPDVYAAADLVVGRAGAGTIAELAAVGKPALLIPLPGAGGDEQTANASVLGAVGAAVVIAQHEATPERLLDEIRSLLDNAERRERMRQSARLAAHPEAAARLVDILTLLARGSRHETANPR